MQVGFVQFSPIFGDKASNIKRSIDLMERVNADLLVLPELCNTGYLFSSENEVEELAEEIPSGMSIRAWRQLAERRKTHLVAGIAEKAGDKFYNSAVLISPTGTVEVYRKAHLFDEEKLWFTPGDTSFAVYNIGPAKIGMMVCFDWFFPEVTRILSLQGADIICHPANLVLPHCQDAMITRCLENHVFAITCNRTGADEISLNRRVRFTGKSQIVTPDGTVLTRAGEIGEAVRVVQIDPSNARDKSVTQRNDLFKDRRTELFEEIIHGPISLPAKLDSAELQPIEQGN